MANDCEQLFNDELMMLNWLVEQFSIPDEVFKEHGSSALMMLVLEDGIKLRHEHLDADKEIDLPDNAGLLERVQAGFECLCQSAPHIPRAAIRQLSIAYGAFVILTKDYRDGVQTEFEQSDIRALFAVTVARGMAMGEVGMSSGKMHSIMEETQRKQRLSEAGAKGAKERLKPFAQLKSWALEAGARLPANKDTARKLAARLPPHLADVSNDAARLIYEALLNSAKPSENVKPARRTV